MWSLHVLSVPPTYSNFLLQSNGNSKGILCVNASVNGSLESHVGDALETKAARTGSSRPRLPKGRKRGSEMDVMFL